MNGRALPPETRGAKPPARDALTEREHTIAYQILKEIQTRLRFLLDIGLDYVTLDRTASTLSGGEAQRIRLATQIGSGLTGVLYVCDEPSIGLHPADDSRLITTLQHLRDLGNTVLIVEHDEAIMRSADHIVDLGPGAGEHGGRVVAIGKLDDICASDESVTGAYLSGRREIALPLLRRPGNGEHITIKGARENNLKNIDVEIPLGKLVVVTGVSGSGKSTLINEVFFKKLAQLLYRAKDRPGESDGLVGIEDVDKVVDIDQSPIGRTPRSNPATYVGAFTPIRELFASVPESRARGYKPGRFSFNVKGGRCEACAGDGYIADRDAIPAQRYRGLRGVPGKALQPRSPGDHVQRLHHRRCLGHDGFRGAGASSGTSPRCATSWKPCVTWAWATSSWASPPPLCPAEKRSASSSQLSCPGGLPARPFTFWTNQPLACHSWTATPCWEYCTGWWMRAIR